MLQTFRINYFEDIEQFCIITFVLKLQCLHKPDRTLCLIHRSFSSLATTFMLLLRKCLLFYIVVLYSVDTLVNVIVLEVDVISFYLPCCVFDPLFNESLYILYQCNDMQYTNKLGMSQATHITRKFLLLFPLHCIR